MKAARELRQGDASSGADVDVGAMAWDQQVATVERLVNAALAGGAKLEIGGYRAPRGRACSSSRPC